MENKPDRVKFVLDGCDISFMVTAPADMTIRQLLQQADRIVPDYCACGVRSFKKWSEHMYKSEFHEELRFDYHDLVKIDESAECRIEKNEYAALPPDEVYTIKMRKRDAGKIEALEDQFALEVLNAKAAIDRLVEITCQMHKPFIAAYILQIKYDLARVEDHFIKQK